jgi:gluconokinase
MSRSLVFMGVAGCGKSSLAAAVARAEGLPLVEGDDFHCASSLIKMRQGIALNDDDRHGWLLSLGKQLQGAPGGIALTCSSLKRKYRDRLREASPGLRFVFLELTREAAMVRVEARASHFFSASLVDSQFAALEPPTDEPGVLRVDATASLAQLQSQVSRWRQVQSDQINPKHIPQASPTSPPTP